MGCETWREALSARLDGEELGVTPAALDSHLDACPDCSDWAARLDRLHRLTRVSPAMAVPDLTAGILAAAAGAAPARRGPGVSLVLRWLLVVIAALEIGLAAPEITGGWHTGGELGTWAIASAVGFLSVAMRPQFAGAVLPMLICATIFTAFVSIRDLAGGMARLSHEGSHLLLALGVVVLALLWHRERDAAPPAPETETVPVRGSGRERSRRAA